MKKNTKRTLLFSVLALILCSAMLIGTTFAWFTDSASTAVNKIQAGTLDIGLEMKQGGTWVNAEGQTLAWQKAAGHASEEVLWEPGCTYKLPTLKITNKGNLALQFKILVNGIEGNLDLLDVLEFSYAFNWMAEDSYLIDSGNFAGSNLGTTPYEISFNKAAVAENMFGTDENDADFVKGYLLDPKNSTPSYPMHVGYYTLQAHMKEDAGNEYQGKALENLSITVVATQVAEVEVDSIDGQYDKDAKYPEARAASTATSFAEALSGLETAGNENVVINVIKDIDGITGIKTASGNDLAVDFGGNTVTVGNTVGSAGTVTNGMQLLKGSDVTLRNGTYKPSSNSVRLLVQNYSDLTLENVTLDATTSNNCDYVLSSNCGNVVIKGNTNITANSGKVALDVMHWENAAYKEAGTSVVFDKTMTGTVDGKIEVYCYRNGSVVTPVDDGGATLVIKGGTFKNTGLTLEAFNAFVADGYHVTENADGSWTVSAN